MKNRFFFLVILFFIFLICDIIYGSISIPLQEIFMILKGNNEDIIYHEIIINHRLPKAITACLTGISLSVAGVLMQTLFRNPLAGPDVLGITSGASLGVALLTLGSTVLPFYFIASWGQVIAATIGAIGVLLVILIVSIKIPQTISLLIIGVMLGYFTSAVVSILQSFSNPDTLKLFISWTFGSLSSVGWEQLKIMFLIVVIGVIISFSLQKRLNILLLGDNYSTGLGVSVFHTRLIIIVITGLLAGVSTAFTGPIAFIGITIPHLARGIFQTMNHRIIIPASMLCGSIIMLICDLISQLPGSQGVLPINAVTALFGAPVIIWIIMRNGRK